MPRTAGRVPLVAGRALLAALPVLFLFGGLLACADAAGPAGLAAPGDQIVVVFGQPTDPYPADDWELVSGEVDDDALVLRIRHAGGCRDHDYWLLAVDDWIPLPDAGPAPTVGVALRLAHEANDDPCEALLSPTLRFGLEPLGEAYRAAYGPGPARLLLQITDGRDGFAIHVFEWRLGGG